MEPQGHLAEARSQHRAAVEEAHAVRLEMREERHRAAAAEQLAAEKLQRLSAEHAADLQKIEASKLQLEGAQVIALASLLDGSWAAISRLCTPASSAADCHFGCPA